MRMDRWRRDVHISAVVDESVRIRVMTFEAVFHARKRHLDAVGKPFGTAGRVLLHPTNAAEVIESMHVKQTVAISGGLLGAAIGLDWYADPYVPLGKLAFIDEDPA